MTEQFYSTEMCTCIPQKKPTRIFIAALFNSTKWDVSKCLMTIGQINRDVVTGQNIRRQ